MQVRLAHPSDAAAIQGLYEELVPGDHHIHVDPQQLAVLATHPTNHLFVLEATGRICGTAFLTICLNPMYGGAPDAIVENVIVDASVRGQGGGRLLMAAVEERARAARCTKLALLSTTTRIDAHAFFTALGFDGDKKRGFVRYLNRVPPLPPRRPSI